MPSSSLSITLACRDGSARRLKWLIQFYQEQGDSEKCNAIINHAKPLALRFFQEVQLLPEMASI
jgi:hypothetical protein